MGESFSAKTKQELCEIPVTKDCCAVAESCGILLFSNTFGAEKIRIVTSSKEFAKRLVPLFNRAFRVSLPAPEIGSGGRMTFRIEDEKALGRIFSALGYDWKRNSGIHLHQNLVEDECCRAAFLRGVFLSAGTVAAPDKKSHLELVTHHQALSREVMSLMLDMGMQPKIGARKAQTLLYFKETEKIEDFLTRIGATHASMDIMQGKVEKQVRNQINRAVNFEAANVIKASNAAAKQITVLRQAMELAGNDCFPENLRETVQLRLEYPTARLAELAEKFDPPISKPGLSHRLKKLVLLAEEIIHENKEESM